jgi:hypothetical protein
MKYKILILVVIPLALLTGCSTKVNLTYHPVIEKQTDTGLALCVNHFEDVRPVKDQVGSIRNVFGMPVIRLVTDDKVPEWMSQALMAELSRTGYKIVEDNHAANYEIEGKIATASATSYLMYHGKMHVELVVKQEGNEIFRKCYKTAESGGANWAAQASSCVNTLELNLQEICRQFISDLNCLLMDKKPAIELQVAPSSEV